MPSVLTTHLVMNSDWEATLVHKKSCKSEIKGLIIFPDFLMLEEHKNVKTGAFSSLIPCWIHWVHLAHLPVLGSKSTKTSDFRHDFLWVFHGIQRQPFVMLILKVHITIPEQSRIFQIKKNSHQSNTQPGCRVCGSGSGPLFSVLYFWKLNWQSVFP